MPKGSNDNRFPLGDKGQAVDEQIAADHDERGDERLAPVSVDPCFDTPEHPGGSFGLESVSQERNFHGD